jgi:SAM-dependent methyltransferase
MASHRETIVEQFTKQAVPFSEAPQIKDEVALQLLVRFSGAGSEDTVLDVACGPGLVACAFAQVVREVVGIDLTPRMIERALELKKERSLENVSFRVGDVLPFPFPDGSFSIVTSRFAFHHFPDPRAVFAEMKRVTAPGGKLLVVDVAASPDPGKAAAFNRMERLRDPSHAEALTLAGLSSLFLEAGLAAPRTAFYKLEADLEAILSSSFPASGDADRIRRLVVDSLPDDGLGMSGRREGEEIRLAYPIALLVSER